MARTDEGAAKNYQSMAGGDRHRAVLVSPDGSHWHGPERETRASAEGDVLRNRPKGWAAFIKCDWTAAVVPRSEG